MLSPDVDVLILECCGPKEVGRCATASQGLRTAARLSWKSLATRKFPSLASIAHAASQLPDAKPFDYASAYHSHLHLRVSECRLDDFERLGEINESALSRIVVTYELCTRRYGRSDEFEPFFVWSGRPSAKMRLWTGSEQLPAEMQRWWDNSPPASGPYSPTDLRLRHSGEGAPNLAARIYITKASKTILLYSGGVNFVMEGVLPPQMYFIPQEAPESPRFADPSPEAFGDPDMIAEECCLRFMPVLDIFEGLAHFSCFMPEGVDAPDDTMLRYISGLDIDWLADPSSDYRGEDEGDY